MRLAGLALFSILTLLPSGALAQEPRARVSVKLVNVTVSEALSTVCRQAGLGFATVPSARRMTIVAKDMPVLEALDHVAKAAGWQYFYSDGVVFMGPRTARELFEAHPDGYCIIFVPDWRPHRLR